MRGNTWGPNDSWVVREGFPEEAALKLRPDGGEGTTRRGSRQGKSRAGPRPQGGQEKRWPGEWGQRLHHEKVAWG